jgi:hypothetical protein
MELAVETTPQLSPCAPGHPVGAVRGRFLTPALVAAAVLFGFTLVLFNPSLTSWINDEPKLIGNALLANESGTLAREGLTGSFKAFYGPIPTWFYQASLLITHNVSGLVVIHAICFYAATIGGLVWLARELQLRIGFIAAIAVSPVVYYYSRILWDNSFNVPLSILLIAAYARFVRAPSHAAAAGVAVLAVVSMSVHAMIAPLVAGIGIHALWRQRPALRRHWLPIVVSIVAVLGILTPYLMAQYAIVTGARTFPPQSEALTPVNPYLLPPQTPAEAAWFAFTGTRHFGGDFLNAANFADGTLKTLYVLCSDVSRLIHVLFVVGAVFWVWRIATRPKSIRGPRGELCMVGGIALVLQSAYFAFLQVIPAGHYFNGTLAVFALFAWVGIHELPVAIGTLIVWILTVSWGAALVLGVLQLERQQGDGTTIAEQRRVLNELHAGGATGFLTDVINPAMFPQAMRTLARLDGIDFQGPPPASQPPCVTQVRRGQGMFVTNDLPPERVKQMVFFDLRPAIHWQR